MKLTDRHTLVERRRDNGEIIEYIICNGIKPVENGEPNEYCWESGMYAFTLEGAIKTAALRCYTPVYRYVLIGTDSHNNIREDIFDDYEKARIEFEKRIKEHEEDKECFRVEYYNDNWVECYYEDENNIALELIKVKVD